MRERSIHTDTGSTWRVRKRCTDNGYNTDKQKHTDTDCNMEGEEEMYRQWLQHRQTKTYRH